MTSLFLSMCWYLYSAVQYSTVQHVLVPGAVQEVPREADPLVLAGPPLLDGLLDLVVEGEGEGVRVEHLVLVGGHEPHEGVPHDHEGRHLVQQRRHGGQVVPRRRLVDVPGMAVSRILG